jgi:predicted TIM-barrel fold metal-dependent hydrolase
MIPPVSAFSYVIEPTDLWSSRSVSGAPTWSSEGDSPGWLVGDFTCTIPAWQLRAVVDAGAGNGERSVDLARLPGGSFTPDGRLLAQDMAGVAAEVLYPSPQLWGTMALLLDGQTEAACVRAYNDWLAEFVAHDPARLVGVAAIPSGCGIESAVAEARRAADLGLKGIVLRNFPTTGGVNVQADDDPLWEVLVESQLVVSFDSTFGPSPGSQIVGPKGVSTATALISFVYEAVVERFPELRMVLAAPTAAWIPHWLEQADDLYLRRPGTHNPDLTRALPSDYLRVRPFFVFTGDDALLEYPDEYISFGHLMWSNYYPTYYAAEAQTSFVKIDALPDDLSDRILSATCRGLYGLPDGADIDLEPALKPLVHAIPT